jgi:hypothetical protein
VAKPGRVVARLGPNGAGKTTFVRAVATLLRPDTGTLSVAGIDALRQPAQARQLIGLAGQYAAVEPAMTGPELHLSRSTRPVLRKGWLDPTGKSCWSWVAGRPRPMLPAPARPGTTRGGRRVPPWAGRHPPTPLLWCGQKGFARPGELGATCWS